MALAYASQRVSPQKLSNMDTLRNGETMARDRRVLRGGINKEEKFGSPLHTISTSSGTTCRLGRIRHARA